jgi:hypothetical protein
MASFFAAHGTTAQAAAETVPHPVVTSDRDSQLGKSDGSITTQQKQLNRILDRRDHNPTARGFDNCTDSVGTAHRESEEYTERALDFGL